MRMPSGTLARLCLALLAAAPLAGCDWGLYHAGLEDVQSEGDTVDDDAATEAEGDLRPDLDGTGEEDAADREEVDMTECTPGTAMCDGPDLLTCTPAGVYERTPCEFGCNSVVECDGDGRIVGSQDCTPLVCVGGACTECVPGTTSCAGTLLVECDASGTATTTDCSPFDCNPDRLACNECDPGSSWCVDDLTAASCGTDGLPQAPETCPFGCNGGRGECNACLPDTATCSGGNLDQCGPDGLPLSTTVCPLGCDATEDPNRCYGLDPSNLDPALLCANPAGNLVVSSPVTIDTSAGTISGVPSASIAFVSVPQGSGNPAIGVFSFGRIEINANVTVTGTNALALLACGDVTISGVIRACADRRTGGPGGWNGGLLEQDGAGPGYGHLATGENAAPFYAPGGGGGGFGGTGGSGGNSDGTGTTVRNGGAGGVSCGLPELTPLIGGSGGGGGGSYWAGDGQGGGGGGAVQIVAGGTLTIQPGGGVNVCGAGGGPETVSRWTGGGGGGSGGGILLEAATVAVGGTLAANGGGGAGGEATYDSSNPIATGGEAGRFDATRAAGGTPSSGPWGSGGRGGQGGAAGGANANGEGGVAADVGGGGGGGAGRIRINTYSPASLTDGDDKPVHDIHDLPGPLHDGDRRNTLAALGSQNVYATPTRKANWARGAGATLPTPGSTLACSGTTCSVNRPIAYPSLMSPLTRRSQ
jgi:hypothetical protein